MIQRSNTSMSSLLAARLFKNRGEAYWLPIHVGQPGPIFAAKHTTMLATAGGVALAIALPLSTNQPYKLYAVKKVDAGIGTVDITPQGGELIEGAPVYQLAVQYESVIIQNDGANWWILSMI